MHLLICSVLPYRTVTIAIHETAEAAVSATAVDQELQGLCLREYIQFFNSNVVAGFHHGHSRGWHRSGFYCK